MRKVNSATDKEGSKIEVGSMVEIFDIYNKKFTGRKIIVTDIHHQGRDGTILHFDEPPNLDFPHNFTHVASDVKVCK
ncbi:MAG: hypothetical protein KAW92_10535 [Candidatus Cloacimonetes bacterium]|nr:hypothetical protein [Candidatus Cloacimonadota bacterium]